MPDEDTEAATMTEKKVAKREEHQRLAAEVDGPVGPRPPKPARMKARILAKALHEATTDEDREIAEVNLMGVTAPVHKHAMQFLKYLVDHAG